MEPNDAADDEPEGTPSPEGSTVDEGDAPVEDEQDPDAAPGVGGGLPAWSALTGFEFLNRDYLAAVRETIGRVISPSLAAMNALTRQQASWAKTFVVPNYAPLEQVARQMSESMLAGFDFGKFMPKIDFSEFLRFEPAGGWDKWWANWWPPNWPRDIDPNAMQALLNDEGLPLVWVPRAEIVTQVLAAGSREERVAVLVARRAQVAEDCRAVLDDIAHPRLLTQRRLLEAAVDALAAGHDEAAQSLAVLVAETAVLLAAAAGHIDGLADRKGIYDRVKDAVRVDLDNAPPWLLRVAASLAPVAGFFTKFHPHQGDPVPEGVSRHVTVHFAFDEHYTEEHAVVAVLLMASVVRGLQQGWETWEKEQHEDA